MPPPDNLPMSSFSFARLSVQERALLLKLTQNPRCAFRHALDLELWDARDEVPLGKRRTQVKPRTPEWAKNGFL